MDEKAKNGFATETQAAKKAHGMASAREADFCLGFIHLLAPRDGSSSSGKAALTALTILAPIAASFVASGAPGASQSTPFHEWASRLGFDLKRVVWLAPIQSAPDKMTLPAVSLHCFARIPSAAREEQMEWLSGAFKAMQAEEAKVGRNTALFAPFGALRKVETFRLVDSVGKRVIDPFKNAAIQELWAEHEAFALGSIAKRGEPAKQIAESENAVFGAAKAKRI